MLKALATGKFEKIIAPTTTKLIMVTNMPKKRNRVPWVVFRIGK
jgi:hypothetical protein